MELNSDVYIITDEGNVDGIIIGGIKFTDVIAVNVLSFAKLIGIAASDLSSTYSISQLKAAGYTDEFVLAGGSLESTSIYGITINADIVVSPGSLIIIDGTDINDIIAVNVLKFALIRGIPVEDLVQQYTASQLKAAGFDVTADPLPIYSSSGIIFISNVSISNNRTFNASTVNIVETIVTSTLIVANVLDISPSILAINYSPQQLETGGYTQSEILESASYTAEQLVLANYTVSQLKTAGYTDEEIIQSGYTATQLREASFTAAQLQPYFSIANLQIAGYSNAQIILSGYTLAQLRGNGSPPYYTASQLQTYFTIAELKGVGYSDAQIIQAGYSETLLKDANYTANQLQPYYSVTDLQGAGYSTAQIIQAGYSATSLRGTGSSPYYTVSQLQPYFSVTDLQGAGYTDSQIIQSGYSATELRGTGSSPYYTAAQLQSYFTISQLQTAGYSDAQIIQAGYSATLLNGATYTANQLQPYFTISQLQTAGYSAAQIIQAGYSATLLRGATYTANQLQPYFTISQLQSAGYSDAQIIQAGYSATLLSGATYTASQLQPYFTISQLQGAGYSDAQIIQAGYSLSLLIGASYTATQLRAAGYTVTQLQPYFTISQLQTAGYTDSEIIQSGYSVTQLTSAGYTNSQLISNGMGALLIENGTLSLTNTSNWTNVEPSLGSNWVRSIGMNNSGSIQVRGRYATNNSVTTNGILHPRNFGWMEVSTNYGTTWRDISNSSNLIYSVTASIAMSADGSKVAYIYNDKVWYMTTSNNGSTWSTSLFDSNFTDIPNRISMSYDGTKIAVAGNVGVYIINNAASIWSSGTLATWSTITPPALNKTYGGNVLSTSGPYRYIKIDSNGVNMIVSGCVINSLNSVIANDSVIFTSMNSGTNWASNNPATFMYTNPSGVFASATTKNGNTLYSVASLVISADGTKMGFAHTSNYFIGVTMFNVSYTNSTTTTYSVTSNTTDNFFYSRNNLVASSNCMILVLSGNTIRVSINGGSSWTQVPIASIYYYGCTAMSSDGIYTSLFWNDSANNSGSWVGRAQ